MSKQKSFFSDVAFYTIRIIKLDQPQTEESETLTRKWLEIIWWDDDNHLEILIHRLVLFTFI